MTNGHVRTGLAD